MPGQAVPDSDAGAPNATAGQCITDSTELISYSHRSSDQRQEHVDHLQMSKHVLFHFYPQDLIDQYKSIAF